MSGQSPTILITSGEPAGIGPDICIALAASPLPGRPVFLSNAQLIERRADALDVDLTIEVVASVTEASAHVDGVMRLIDVPLAAEVLAGKLDPANARHVLDMLERATALCASGDAAALVTAPVQKSVIDTAGVPFTGHTESVSYTHLTLPTILLV